MEYPSQTWRLLISAPMNGAWNMAVDDAIMEAVEHEHVLPTLRLYSWDPPCLSIGYAQSINDVDQDRLQSLGWDLVRRPTGGRAILHTDELTYSVIAPLNDPRISGGVLESYRHLSAALLSALHALNLPALSQPNATASNNHSKAPVCFEVPSNYEIVVNGKKLVGSAQARRRNMLLQHGSLPLYGDLTRIIQVLSYPDEESRHQAGIRLLSHATTVETIIGKVINFEEAVQAFISGFEGELNLQLKPSTLTESEHARAQILMQEKYAHAIWLKRI